MNVTRSRSVLARGALVVALAATAAACTSRPASAPTTTSPRSPSVTSPAAGPSSSSSTTTAQTANSCAKEPCGVSMGMELDVLSTDTAIHCVDPDTSGLCTADFRPGGVEVRVDIINHSTDAQLATPSDLQLETADGQLHGYEVISQIAGSAGGVHDCNPAPGGSPVSLAPGGQAANLAVCFAVPPALSKDAMKLIFQHGSGNPATIDLP